MNSDQKDYLIFVGGGLLCTISALCIYVAASNLSLPNPRTEACYSYITAGSIVFSITLGSILGRWIWNSRHPRKF